MSNKKLVPFFKEGETWLREVNPYEQERYIGGTGSGVAYDIFEHNALSTAKPLLQPFPVKEVYGESELSQVYQIQDTETGIWGTVRYITEIVDDLDSPVREAWKYVADINEPVMEIKEYYKLQVDTYLKGHIATAVNSIDYETASPTVAERTRIIGIINEIVTPYYPKITEMLLTKITNGKSG